MIFSAFTDILERPFEEALDALADLGFSTVDLRSKLGDGHNVDTLTGAAATRVRNALAGRGLHVASVASWGVNPMDGRYEPAAPAYRQAMRERVAHLADLATRVGAPHVRVYSFKRPPLADAAPITDAALRADNAAFLCELADVCAAQSRILLVENEPPTLTATVAELGDLMRRACHDHLRVNWDIVNGWRAGEVPWAEGVFDPIAGHVAQVHVKGARAAADGTAFATMALPGRDDVPHAAVFRALRASGFDGVMTIDPHYGQFAPADKLTHVADPVLEVVRQTMQFLQTEILTA